jgi:hypothetical protein
MRRSALNGYANVVRTGSVASHPSASILDTGEPLQAKEMSGAVSYRLDGDELVFDRSLGRPRNAVVLPSGWYCTFSSAPATITRLPDGRVRLDYWNDRPEALDVLLKGRRRLGGATPQGRAVSQ